MSYSIFHDTMADMNYRQIETAAELKQPVLFPIAVIEEHGPHLCLGSDTYLTYNFCSRIKASLNEAGIESLIAPPFYWGINTATGGFAGSFTVKPESMISILCDLLTCLKNWGFDKIFLFNCHGDYKHNMTIVDTAKKAHSELGIGCRFVVPDFFLNRAGLSGKEPYILVHSTKPDPLPEYLDIHAGGFETSFMMLDFPDLVDKELAYTLESSCTTFEGLKVWQQGGEKSKEVTPLGYCGNPSNIDLDGAKTDLKITITDVSKVLIELLRGRDE